jgi:hypothetical protein
VQQRLSQLARVFDVAASRVVRGAGAVIEVLADVERWR